MERTADQPPTGSASHTWHEFLVLPDDDRRELVDGQFIDEKRIDIASGSRRRSHL